MNKLYLKALIRFLLGLSIMASQVTVYAENNDDMTAWVMVGDSPLLDRSSKSMFKGNYNSGIKYGRKALARSQSAYTQIVAQHNLCIAYTKTNAVALAKSHCELAQKSTIDKTFLKQIKPGLYKVVRNRASADLPVLDKMLAHNLRKEGINTEIDRLARAD
ncbi:MAG: hypothetical protein GKR93_06750 [Gammaproteobacteria bacterium]|nr:hypothetical protein [Gammaproteobacteria bacterium]